MVDQSSSLVQRLKRNEDGILYLIVGSLTAAISWFLVPIVGLVSVYCGSRLYRENKKTVAGGIISVAGFTGVALWIGWLLTAGM